MTCGAVLAARDVAAERCRAAALDSRHHLQLVEADVPGIVFAPHRSVVAKDIRNLQRWMDIIASRYAIVRASSSS